MVEQHTARRQGLLEAKGHESVEETWGSVRREEEEQEVEDAMDDDDMVSAQR